MRTFRLACLAALVCADGYVTIEKQSAVGSEILTISAQHAETPPTLDGKSVCFDGYSSLLFRG